MPEPALLSVRSLTARFGGVVIAEGTPSEVQRDPEVIRTYLGGSGS